MANAIPIAGSGQPGFPPLHDLAELDITNIQRELDRVQAAKSACDGKVTQADAALNQAINNINLLHSGWKSATHDYIYAKGSEKGRLETIAKDKKAAWQAAVQEQPELQKKLDLAVATRKAVIDQVVVTEEAFIAVLTNPKNFQGVIAQRANPTAPAAN